MSWTLVFNLVGLLCTVVQRIWPKGTGMGTVKKTVVTTATTAAVTAVGGILTGGAKKTWDEMGGNDIISGVIDQIVATAFPDAPAVSDPVKQTG